MNLYRAIGYSGNLLATPDNKRLDCKIEIEGPTNTDQLKVNQWIAQMKENYGDNYKWAVIQLID